MSLADQIIEHGPYHDGDALPASADINELRDELIAARTLKELLGRFQVDINFWDDEADMRCDACRTWWVLGEGGLSTLAELVQRAGEHAEVCK